MFKWRSHTPLNFYSLQSKVGLELNLILVLLHEWVCVCVCHVQTCPSALPLSLLPPNVCESHPSLISCGTNSCLDTLLRNNAGTDRKHWIGRGDSVWPGPELLSFLPSRTHPFYANSQGGKLGGLPDTDTFTHSHTHTGNSLCKWGCKVRKYNIYLSRECIQLVEVLFPSRMDQIPVYTRR